MVTPRKGGTKFDSTKMRVYVIRQYIYGKTQHTDKSAMVAQWSGKPPLFGGQGVRFPYWTKYVV